MSALPSGPAAQRRACGLLCLLFGLAHAAAAAWLLLSSLGPSPLLPAPRTWSLLLYGHFVLFVASGFGLLLACGAATRVFHGGPFVDFLLAAGGLVLSLTLAAEAHARFSAPWAGLLPGLFLAAAGLRLRAGRPLLSAAV